jgi:hypothetical protein
MGAAESQILDPLRAQNCCGHDPSPRKMHDLIYKWPTNNGAWHQWNKAVVAPYALNGIVLGVTYQSDVQNHFLATLRALNQHADVGFPLDRIRTYLRHLNLRSFHIVSCKSSYKSNFRTPRTLFRGANNAQRLTLGHLIPRRTGESSYMRLIWIDHLFVSRLVVQQEKFSRGTHS